MNRVDVNTNRVITSYCNIIIITLTLLWCVFIGVCRHSARTDDHVHGAAIQVETAVHGDGVPAQSEPEREGTSVFIQHQHVRRRRRRRRVCRRTAAERDQLLLRRQREELLAAVPRRARLRQPVPVRVRRAGQRAEHRRADAQRAGRLADQPDPVRAGRRRSGANGRVHAVHVLHVPVHGQEGGVLARGSRVRAVPHVRVAGAAHHVHRADAHIGHVEIRGRQVSVTII